MTDREIAEVMEQTIAELSDCIGGRKLPLIEDDEDAPLANLTERWMDRQFRRIQ